PSLTGWFHVRRHAWNSRLCAGSPVPLAASGSCPALASRITGTPAPPQRQPEIHPLDLTRYLYRRFAATLVEGQSTRAAYERPPETDPPGLRIFDNYRKTDKDILMAPSDV